MVFVNLGLPHDYNKGPLLSGFYNIISPNLGDPFFLQVVMAGIGPSI